LLQLNTVLHLQQSYTVLTKTQIGKNSNFDCILGREKYVGLSQQL